MNLPLMRVPASLRRVSFGSSAGTSTQFGLGPRVDGCALLGKEKYALYAEPRQPQGGIRGDFGNDERQAEARQARNTDVAESKEPGRDRPVPQSLGPDVRP